MKQLRLDSVAVKKFVTQQGMDMVGIARVADFPASLSPHHPADFLPGAQSLIVLGMRLLNGMLETPDTRIALGGINAIVSRLDSGTVGLGRFIEDHGYRVVLLTSGIPAEMTAESRGLGADLALKNAAVLAGLGVIGTSKLLLTPRWGPRVRLTALITDASLEPDKPLEANYCAGCNLCASICPAQAIAGNGEFDTNKCIRTALKFGLGSFIRFATGLVDKPAEEIKKQIRDPFFWNLYQAIGYRTIYTCSECIKVCPVGK